MITKSVKQNDKEIETGKSFSLISRMRLDSPSFK